MGRGAALRRCAVLLRAAPQLEREAASGWLGAAASNQQPPLLAFAAQQQQQQQQQRRLSSTAASQPADQLPLPEAKAKDDLEDAVKGEAETLPLTEADEAALAQRGGQHLVATDALAALPLGQALREEAPFQGRSWSFETGKLARLADGSCLVQAEGTTVLAAATSAAPPWSRRDAHSLQLDVEYREKLYAVGRIPSTYNKREGAAKEHEVLSSRRIGRALRPLFPKGLPLECGVFASVLSADGGADPDVMAVSAASAALMCSGLPWSGPVAAARVALLSDGTLVVGPSVVQQEAAQLNLLVAATNGGRVTMLEADGDQVPEAALLEALRAGVAATQELLAPQRRLAAQTGRHTRAAALAGADPAAVQRVGDLIAGPIEAILRNGGHTKASRAAALQQAKEAALAKLKATGAFRTEFARVPGSGCVTPADLEHAFSAHLAATLRHLAVAEGWRCDGRGAIDVRPVHCELGAMPIVHGSSLFSRGETQSLCTATVGRRGEGQKVESLLGGEGAKRLFVNYAFPPFAVGDVSTGGLRREMGHSELAERALTPVLPSPDTFPFSLRLNADTLASAGSSSMAAVCGGALALLDAGVPLKALVAGVSVGLVTEFAWRGEARPLAAAPVEDAAAVAPMGQYELLTDLQGLEDQLGDMDLKVAGTRAGVTALQLDVKLHGGVPLDVLEQAIGAAARGRAKVLSAMEAVVPAERPPTSPAFGSVTVPANMLGRVIGTGGAAVRELEEAFDVRVDIADTGVVSIYGPSQEAYKKAAARVLGVAGESVKEGQLYRGTVVKLLDYGALVVLEESGLRALLHISEVSAERVRAMEDVLAVGQVLDVVCLGKDPKGQVKLSRKAALARAAAQARSSASVAAGGGVDPDK